MNSDYSETPILVGSTVSQTSYMAWKDIQPAPRHSSHPSPNDTYEKALVNKTAYKEPRTLTVRTHQAVPNISSYLSHSAEAQDTEAARRHATLLCVNS